MTDGVLLQGADGRVVAMNPAAQVLLGLTADQLRGRDDVHPDWTVLRPDGTVWPIAETPAMVTLSTGVSAARPDGRRTAAWRGTTMATRQHLRPTHPSTPAKFSMSCRP